MAESQRKHPLGGAAKARRREVRRRLSEFGLRRGPPQIGRAPRPEAGQLDEALERLGPVFAAFASYRASWADPFATPLMRAEAAPPTVVHELIAQELGRVPAELFAAFEDEPCEVGLLYQAHRARLAGGREVVVKVAPPGPEEEVAADLDALPLLSGVFDSCETSAAPLESVIDDFCDAVKQLADLAHEAATWEALAGDAEEFESFCAPCVYRDLSSPRVLTLGRLPGRTLADLFKAEGDCAAAARPAGMDRRKLASRLCTVWLRQALLGRFFPAEARLRQVTILPDGRAAFTGTFAALPAASRRDLWGYLLAASTNDPDRACSHLFRVMDKDTASVHEDGLRNEFRQAVLPGGESGDLGELLALHWRLARSHGCRPPLHLLRFYRGLLHVNAAARRLAPGRDSLRDGLETVRAIATLAQMRDLMSLAQLNESLERYAPVLLELPRILDEALTLVAAGNARMHLHVRETVEKRRRKNSTALTAAALLALAGAALLAHGLAAAEGQGGWWAKVGAGAFVLAGLLLFARLGGR